MRFFYPLTIQFVNVRANRTETMLIEANGLNFRPIRPYPTMEVVQIDGIPGFLPAKYALL